MLPLLREQDLGAFSLEVFIIPADFFASKRDSYLFLEQYQKEPLKNQQDHHSQPSPQRGIAIWSPLLALWRSNSR